MLTCKEVSQLISESLDKKLPFRQRLGIGFHLMMCGLCRSYRKQMLILRQVLQDYAASKTPGTGVTLSDKARNRIKIALQKQPKPRAVEQKNKADYAVTSNSERSTSNVE